MGGKKGGGGASPKEAPETGRSKQLVKIVEVISEGEVEGFANGEQSIFFDNTPLRNANGTYNFSNTEWQARDGQQHQAMLNGFITTEKEVSVSTEVKKAQPITRTVTDGKVHRIRLTLGVSSLFQQNDNGDTHGTQVDFKITVGNRVQTLSINGKYSSQYLRNVVIDNLPAVPFQIKVERVQADSTTQRLQNKTIWASYTEIIDNQFTYPNTALIGIKFDSEYFASIPTRTYDIKGIKVQVPSNYNPETRQYSGLWDGSFKIAWTDNPAWILYDIVTSKRYGLGQRLGEFGADKWALYQVAQYCDQLVPDGFGNREPRFTCNVWLTEQRSAYDVINDICSIFRAMPVWNGTTLTVIQDRPADPVWTYTNANVIGGFSRQYSAMKARHNAIQVEYKDKDNNYETTIEYVSDDEAIRKYGLNLKKVQAFGCTSRGQAYRTGKWILETERLETETITFSVGAEGLMHLPGDIIKVADSHYAGTEIGGRVLAVGKPALNSDLYVKLDRRIEISGNSYLSYIDNNGQVRNIKIVRLLANNIVHLARAPIGLETLGVWSLTTEQITARLYRAMSIAENDDGSYTITALQHEPQKEAIVDNGASFETTATTLHQVPKIEHLDVAVSAGNAGISWQTGSGSQIVSYDVKILKDGKLYALHKGLKTTELDLSDLPNGDYQIIITSRNASGQIIDEKSKTFTIDRPPVPENVQVFGGLSDVMISWEQLDDFTETEIWASQTDNISTAKRVARVMANTYSHNIGAAQSRYYWVRHARGQNLGAFYQEAGLKGETGADIDAELALLNEKLSKNIVDEVFDTAAAARGLELTKTVNSIDDVNVYQNANLLYNTQDNRLYKWDGTKYVYGTPASEIDGDILPDQLAEIPTTKLTGKVSKAQIDSNLTSEVSRATTAISQANANLTKLGQDLLKTNANVTAISGNLTTIGNVANATKSDLAKEVTLRQREIANVTANLTTLGGRLDGFNTTITQQGNNLTNVTKTVATLNNTTKQQAVEISGLSAKMSGAESNITKVNNALTTLNKTTAESLKQLNSNLSTNVTAITANMTELQRTVAENGRAFSTASEQLTARLDDLSVGGRNYLLHSGEMLKPWIVGKSPDEPMSQQIIDGVAVLAGSTTNWKHLCQYGRSGLLAGNLNHSELLADLEDGTYIISFDAKAENLNTATKNQLRVGFRNHLIPSGTGKTFYKWVELDGSEWKRYSVTVTITRDDNFSHWYFSLTSYLANTVQIRKVKLEKGSIATDWTPAPEDSEQNFAEISAELTAYKSAQATKENATATQISGLTSRMGSAESNITKVDTALSLLNSSVAESVRTLNTNFTTNISKINANISNVSKTVANETKALADDIGTLTVEVGKANANITAVNKAVANETKARTDALKTVTATLNNTTANVTAVSQAITTLNGTVSAMHTIKTQTVTGGKTAIAGLQLNAKDTESSVLVMADKFGVVASNNGAIQPMFGVSGSGANSVATLNGDLIATGSITASKIAVGGSNLIADPLFTDLAYWRETMATQGTVENGVLKITLNNATAAADGTYIRGLRCKNIPIVRGKQYRLSAKVKVTGDGASECRTTLYMSRYTNANNSTNWVNIATIGDKYGNRDEKISGVVSTGNIPEGYDYFGIYFRIGVRANGGKITNAMVEISEISLLPVADGELIVDGAITATKIATGAVNADKIAANAVTATKIQANSIGTNHIQANAITAGKLDANSVTAGAIQAGAVRADHLAAGQISADKLAVGLGGNLLHNPIFAPASGLNVAPYGWAYSTGTSNSFALDGQKVYLRDSSDKEWGLSTGGMPNETIFSMRFPTTTTTDYQGRCGWLYQNVNVIAGQRYIASVWLAAHRGNADLLIEELNAETNGYVKLLGRSQVITQAISTGAAGDFANYTRVKVIFTAPLSGKIRFALRLINIKGQAEPFLFARRPMLEEAGNAATEPSPWQNAGVTAIHGGQIATNSITAQQIAANTITGNEIVAGTIATKHLAVDSVTATQLAANSVTANKMSVTSLSAISSNIGTVTAGTIRGTTITGNTISGGTISGTTISGTTINGGTVKGSIIEGGTIKAAYLDGASGSFSGTLTVNQLIGSNIIEVAKLNVKISERREQMSGETKRYTVYSRKINIAAAPIERFFCVMNSDVARIIPANQSVSIDFYHELVSYASGLKNTNGVINTGSGAWISCLLIATTSAKTIS